MDPARDDTRISVETLDDWRRIKRNYTNAARTALDEQLAQGGSAEDREVILAHLQKFIDTAFDISRPNVRVNGQKLEDIKDEEEDTEPFDEGFDRHIWSLSDQSLRWDLQIARERRTKPDEVQRHMRELLQAQRELDADEAAALQDLKAEDALEPPTLSDAAFERISNTTSQMFAVVEELNQSLPVQSERSERVKVVADEIKALKL